MPEPYRSTPVFDETTLPAALRAAHRTKAGVWGLIRVVEGELRLICIDPPLDRVLTGPDAAVVNPEQPHFVTPLGPVKMRVDFYSEPPDHLSGSVSPSR
jgi:tellurite resistance-related uncharacterized protein